MSATVFLLFYGSCVLDSCHVCAWLSKWTVLSSIRKVEFFNSPSLLLLFLPPLTPLIWFHFTLSLLSTISSQQYSSGTLFFFWPSLSWFLLQLCTVNWKASSLLLLTDSDKKLPPLNLSGTFNFSSLSSFASVSARTTFWNHRVFFSLLSSSYQNVPSISCTSTSRSLLLLLSSSDQWFRMRSDFFFLLSSNLRHRNVFPQAVQTSFRLSLLICSFSVNFHCQLCLSMRWHNISWFVYWFDLPKRKIYIHIHIFLQ